MTRTTLAVLLAVILPAAAPAEDRGWHHGKGRDRAALRDDLRDAREVEALLRQFDDAAAARNWTALSGVEARVADALRREAEEAEYEIAHEARQAQRSDEEVRRDQDRLQYDARRGDRREAWEDQHDLRDDRQDAARDRRDLIEKAEYRRRIHELSEEWARLRPLRRPRAIERKHDMLVELVRLARLEIRSDVDELHEGRGERRDHPRD